MTTVGAPPRRCGRRSGIGRSACGTRAPPLRTGRRATPAVARPVGRRRAAGRSGASPAATPGCGRGCAGSEDKSPPLVRNARAKLCRRTCGEHRPKNPAGRPRRRTSSWNGPRGQAGPRRPTHSGSSADSVPGATNPCRARPPSRSCSRCFADGGRDKPKDGYDIAYLLGHIGVEEVAAGIIAMGHVGPVVKAVGYPRGQVRLDRHHRAGERRTVPKGAAREPGGRSGPGARLRARRATPAAPPAGLAVGHWADRWPAPRRFRAER